MSIQRALLTGLGLGYLRPAPGTWGSALPVGLVLVFVGFVGLTNPTIDLVIGLFGLVFATACVRFGAFAESEFGRKDPSQVVADEVAGQCVALLALPWRAGNSTDDWIWNGALAATSFFTFRFFDIVKPPPARGLQRLTGGWGILVDDLFAGAYALVTAQLAARFLWPSVLSHLSG